MDYDLYEDSEVRIYSDGLWDEMCGTPVFVECGGSLVLASWESAVCGIGSIGLSERRDRCSGC